MAFLNDSLQKECPCEITLKSLESLPQGSEGLARRSANGGQLLDLTPAMWRTSGSEKLFRQRMLVAAGIILGIWALSVIFFLCGLFYQQKKLTSLQAECAATEKPAREVLEMRKRVRIIQHYSDRTHSALECLREVVGLQPDGVDLVSFEYKRVPAPPTVTFNAQADTVAQVYEFKNGLDESKLFAKGTMKGPIVAKNKQSFQIDMKLPTGGEE